ncbi:glutaredoxin family protein [Ideonella dechloratans]|uniref:glutaredoxin family protein n=1 Tax=Ideonella dechloratans TaxID=36863 RepID=UPI0035B22ABC
MKILQFLQKFMPSKGIYLSLVLFVAAAGMISGYFLVKSFKETGSAQHIDSRAFFGERHATVIVIGSKRCQFCRQAMDFFEKKGVTPDFIDLDTSAEGRRIMSSLGGSAIPQVIIGDTRVQGYWPELYSKALQTL